LLEIGAITAAYRRRLIPCRFRLATSSLASMGDKRRWETWLSAVYIATSIKGRNIAGIDPITGRLAALFHPRLQSWNRHFKWEGPILVGRTQCARATIEVLAINDADTLAFRAQLIDEGVFF
jgi:hypothetical protein